MDNKEKTIEGLRKIFSVTCIAFQTQRDVVEALSGRSVPEYKMELLHKAMLHELNRDDPDMEMIDFYLEQMEKECDNIKQ